MAGTGKVSSGSNVTRLIHTAMSDITTRWNEIMKSLKVLACSLLLAINATSWAAYPERPIEIVSPWPPGQPADVGARVLAELLSDQLRVPVQVVNRPGGGGVIGTNVVAKARPDGYTLGNFN